MLDARSLWTAVLRQAAFDLTNIRARLYSDARLKYLARLWFESDSGDMGSFRWVCEELGLDHSWLRRRLFEIAEERTERLGLQIRRPRPIGRGG